MTKKRLDTEALNGHLAAGSPWAIANGTRLRTRRKHSNMTVRSLADAVGTTGQTIYAIEQGNLVPRDYLRLAIAHVMGCDVSELFPLPTREQVASFMDEAA